MTPSPAERSPRQLYIVLPALAHSGPQPRRRAASNPRHPVMHIRAHRGLRLVPPPRAEHSDHPTGKRLWSGWLDQKHLDRGFLLLAISSALLLLLSSR